MVTATLSLPIGPPLIRSYLFDAYPLAILAGQGQTSLPWILSTFIQLYQRPGSQLKFYAHPWRPGPHLRQSPLFHCPWLDIQQVDQGLLHPLVTFVERCLSRGLYPQVDIDYGCLPWDPRREWLHELLICGIDRAARELEVLAYTPDGGFHVVRVDIETIERATAAAHGLSNTDERPRTVVYRFVDHPSPPTVDVHAVAQQLWDYVESADSSARYRAIAPAIRATWGIATADVLARQLREGTAHDLDIPLRVWWEHKRLLSMCVGWLEGEGWLDSSLELSTQARQLAREAWQARLLALRHGLGHADTRTRIADRVGQTTTTEIDVLGTAARALSGPSLTRRAA